MSKNLVSSLVTLKHTNRMGPAFVMPPNPSVLAAVPDFPLGWTIGHPLGLRTKYVHSASFRLNLNAHSFVLLMQLSGARLKDACWLCARTYPLKYPACLHHSLELDPQGPTLIIQLSSIPSFCFCMHWPANLIYTCAKHFKILDMMGSPTPGASSLALNFIQASCFFCMAAH